MVLVGGINCKIARQGGLLTLAEPRGWAAGRVRKVARAPSWREWLKAVEKGTNG